MQGSEIRPRSIQIAELIIGIAVAAMLVVSALAFGQVAISFGIDVFSTILNSGLESGIRRLTASIEVLAVQDLGPEIIRAFGGQSISVQAAWVFSLIAAFTAPILYAIIWLGLARLSIALIYSGLWGLQSPDDDDPEVGNLPAIPSINRFLLAEDFQKERLSQEDRALLGKSARYSPLVYRNIQEARRTPMLSALGPVFRMIFWGVLTAVVLTLIALAISSNQDLIASLFRAVGVAFGSAFGSALALLVTFVGAISVISAIADVRFARVLSPRTRPEATKRMEMLRKLTVNSPPAQFNSVLKSELSIKLGEIRHSGPLGLDGTKEGFVDQSNFFMEVMIEARPEKIGNYAEKATSRRLWFGSMALVLGAAIPLFLAFPSAIRDLMRFQDFSLLLGSQAPIWMALAIAAGRSVRRIGFRAMNDAERVLRSEWSRTPVVTLRFDGTVNTQTALTGRAVDDSYGSENRVQQSRFDVRLVSANVTGVSEHEGAEQEVYSFSRDHKSDALHDAIASVLRDEGSESTFSAVTATISDNQNISEAAELRKAELKLQIAKTQAELKLLESGSDKPSSDTDSPED